MKLCHHITILNCEIKFIYDITKYLLILFYSLLFQRQVSQAFGEKSSFHTCDMIISKFFCSRCRQYFFICVWKGKFKLYIERFPTFKLSWWLTQNFATGFGKSWKNWEKWEMRNENVDREFVTRTVASHAVDTNWFELDAL